MHGVVTLSLLPSLPPSLSPLYPLSYLSTTVSLNGTIILNSSYRKNRTGESWDLGGVVHHILDRAKTTNSDSAVRTREEEEWGGGGWREEGGGGELSIIYWLGLRPLNPIQR